VGAAPANGESAFSGWKGVGDVAPAAREILFVEGVQAVRINAASNNKFSRFQRMSTILQERERPAHPAYVPAMGAFQMTRRILIPDCNMEFIPANRAKAF
jgi:hypothetical protein